MHKKRYDWLCKVVNILAQTVISFPYTLQIPTNLTEFNVVVKKYIGVFDAFYKKF